MPRRPTCPRLCKRGVHAVDRERVVLRSKPARYDNFPSACYLHGIHQLSIDLGSTMQLAGESSEALAVVGMCKALGFVYSIKSHRPCPILRAWAEDRSIRIGFAVPAQPLLSMRGGKGMERVSLAAGFQPTNDGALHDAFANASPYIDISMIDKHTASTATASSLAFWAIGLESHDGLLACLAGGVLCTGRVLPMLSSTPIEIHFHRDRPRGLRIHMPALF